MSHGEVRQWQEWAGAGDVLAHASESLAVFGFFGPALVLLGLVAGAVLLDRRRGDPQHAEADTDTDTDTDTEVTPPRAG